VGTGSCSAAAMGDGIDPLMIEFKDRNGEITESTAPDDRVGLNPAQGEVALPAGHGRASISPPQDWRMASGFATPML
jgi:hypothetical protein